MKSGIPMRPAGVYSLSPEEKDALTWYVLSGCTKSEAFASFVRPELRVSKPTLDKAASQFFSDKNSMLYIDAYRAELQKLTSHEPVKVKSISAEERKRRKEEAVQKLMDFVVEQSLNIDTVDDKDDIIKFADKLGLLEDKEEVFEQPRRYLPETCSECRYKKFIEENCVEE